MDNIGLSEDSGSMSLSHLKPNEYESKRVRKPPVRFHSLLDQFKRLRENAKATDESSSENRARPSGDIQVDNLQPDPLSLKPTNIPQELNSLPAQGNINCLPPAMSCLMESGRNRLNQHGLQESHSKLNMPSVSTAVFENTPQPVLQTPAKEIFGASYITPRHEGFSTFPNNKTPALPRGKNYEVAPALIRQEPVYINDSGVALSSFYSNTKTTRSGGGYNSECYSSKRQQISNYSRTPLVTHSQVLVNPSRCPTSSNRNVLRRVLQDHFQDPNVGQADPKSNLYHFKCSNAQKFCSPYPNHSQLPYDNENKENDFNYLTLDLSDKWKDVKSVEESTSMAKNHEDPNPHLNFEISKSSDYEKEGCNTKQTVKNTKPTEVVEWSRPPCRPTPQVSQLSNISAVPPMQPVPVQPPKPAPVIMQTAYSSDIFDINEFEVTKDYPMKVQSPPKPSFHAPQPFDQSLNCQPRSEIPSRNMNNAPVVYSSLNKQKLTQLSIKGKTYRVLSQLGRGGSSVVYQALDHHSDRLLAIKRVNLDGVDKISAQGFLKEIEVLEKLQTCDCVIKLCDYEYNWEEETLYVVMEKGDIDFSRLLKDIAKTKKISPLTIASYWIEMVNAVKSIHDNGIIHSDLKPANFLLVAGRLKLIDFGIASSLNVDMTSVVKENAMGTYAYMSPEAFPGFNKTDAAIKISYKSDIWSLGCILYNLVYGRTPFSHIVGNMPRVYTICNPNHTIEYPPSVQCPDRFLMIMKACLQYNPKNRPSAEDLLRLPYLPQVM